MIEIKVDTDNMTAPATLHIGRERILLTYEELGRLRRQAETAELTVEAHFQCSYMDQRPSHWGTSKRANGNSWDQCPHRGRVQIGDRWYCRRHAAKEQP